jgi:tetratricopeptide (TPR) repeat protein
VSQSPVNDLSEQASLRYKQGWRALNRLLHEDRAFSGRERHCAFLNCGGDTASFATVSAVTGFDFPDDGRGLATADWDFDGDLDVWITNRTAPRVRLLRNNTPKKPFVAIKLRGDGIASNRDAIGARLELHLRGSARHPVRIRTLRGGEGFLSQSSNWIHFGLGEATGIEKLVVRWPGGRVQEVVGIEPGKFHRITQGKNAAAVFTPPAARRPLTPSIPVLPRLEESARIIVPPGLPLPQISTLGPDGTKRPWEPKPGRPSVVNIWASWCAPCIAELTEWAAHRDALQSAGLDIVLLNADGPDDSSPEDKTSTETRLRQITSVFTSSRVSETSLHALDHLQRAVLDRWKPLPLPSTFLVDGNGELVAIYKGPVSARQLLDDAGLAQANPTVRRAAAIPFAGIWVDAEAGRADPKRVANLMLDHDELDAAILYLDRSASRLAPQESLPGYRQNLGDIHYMAGLLKQASSTHRSGALASLLAARDCIPTDVRIRKVLAQQLYGAGRGPEAATEMLAAIKINPADSSLKVDLADLYERIGQFAEAKAILEELLAADARRSPVRYQLARVLAKLGDPAGAIRHYKQTLTDSPRFLDAADALAHLLASHPDAGVRSPDEAIALARRLCSITGEKNPAYLDTLSVALANQGDYEQAIKTARQALVLLPAEANPAAEAIRGRIKLYEAGQPFRISPGQP